MDTFERAEKIRDAVKLYFATVSDVELQAVLMALKGNGQDIPPISLLTANLIIDLRGYNYIPSDTPPPLPTPDPPPPPKP